jgi:hypothetical protein
MKKHYLLLSFLLIFFVGFAQNVTITKVIETGCATPFVKTVELYVDGTVNFTTDVTLNYMNNGAAWAANQIDVSALGTVTDKFVYIVRDIALMQAEFPNTTFDASNTVVTGTATNGDDGYQVVLSGNVVSQFGKTETDADNDTDSNWNHEDAVATRKNGIPDLGVWDPTHWDITAEQVLDGFTNCQDTDDPKTKNLEIYFATLGSTFSLGSGSGWTPTAATCTTSLGAISATCTTSTAGAANDTYSATIAFSGGNAGKTFVITTTAGTIGGDSPTSATTGTISISGIPEGTNITVTVKDTANGGVCDLSAMITSPACIPLIINEVLFDPAGALATDLEGDANGDGTRDSAQDEFIEFYNNSNAPLDISGYKVYDASGLTNTAPRHIFPAATIIPANSFLVLFGGGTPTGSFGGSVVQVASEGTLPADRELNLNNAGDVITVLNTSDEVVLTYDSSATGINHGSNESVTRSPDLTESFVLHTTANAALIFSPGLKVDGTTLSLNDNNLNTIGIYPNPISKSVQYLNIQSKSSLPINVIIYNVVGRQIDKQNIANNLLNVSKLSAGMYLVKISQGDRTITKKIIKQ